ncbi:MAG: hypothetical protein H8D43_01225 [Chloroflexi bacterium]|nr:hypothetical protein [Chloroflexota bacterium]
MAHNNPNDTDIWFVDDIENILIAVDKANLDIARHIDTPEMRVYRLGYEAAIGAIASAFGIAYATKTPSASSMQLMKPISTGPAPSFD